MIIRSQDKEKLIDMERMAVVVDNTGTNILSYSMHCNDDSVFFIGHYESKNKAIKVLDMIQEFYIHAKREEMYAEGSHPYNVVFQMPQDVEDE